MSINNLSKTTRTEEWEANYLLVSNLVHFLILLAIVFFFSSCDQGIMQELEQNQPSKTLFKVSLTDNPTELEEVNIDLQGVIIYGKKRNTEQDSIELGTKAGIYNLLDFQDGLDTLIASAEVDFETIKEVRLVLGDNNTVKAGGEVFDLKIPGNAKNGLRIKLCIPLENFEEFILELDFDAEKSVKKTGQGYIMKPVIKVLNPDVEVEETEEEGEVEEIEEEEEGAGEDNDEGEIEENEDESEEEKDSINLGESILFFIEENFEDYRVKRARLDTLCVGIPVILVDIQDRNDKITLYFDEDNNYLQQASNIKKKDIPKVILETVDTQFPDYKLMNNNRLILLADGTEQYELVIRQGNEQKVILINVEGSIICE